MSPSTMAIASGSRATLARKEVPRSSIVGLPPMPLRSERGAHDRCIAGAAAEMAGQHRAYGVSDASGCGAQEGVQRHQDA